MGVLSAPHTRGLPTAGIQAFGHTVGQYACPTPGGFATHPAVNNPVALAAAADAGKAHYFGSLESLRGIAALVVVLFHVSWLTPLYHLGLVRNGYLMVDFFFILSGFVICHSYGNKIHTGTDTGRFLWLRIGRLYPLHFVMIFVALGMECAKYLAEVKYGIVSVYGAFAATNGYSFVTNLLLVHDWGFNHFPSYNTPSWSISAEFFVNILFCLILFVTKSSRKLVLVSIAFIAASAAVVIAGDDPGLTTMMDFGVFRCLIGFFIGVLVYQAYRALGKMAPPALKTGFMADALPLVFGLLLVALLSVKETGPSDFLVLPLVAGFLFFLVRAPGGLADRSLTAKPVSWLGKVSYSIYLVHYPILWCFLQVTRVILKSPVVTVGLEKVPAPHWAMATGLLICAVGTVLVVSHFSYQWIEEPFRKKARKLAFQWFPEAGAPKTSKGPRGIPALAGNLLAGAFRMVRFRVSG